jgi:hypothetical protein
MSNPNDPLGVPPPPNTPIFGEDIPPIYANQFHVSVLGGMVRIVFGEVLVGSGQTFFPHSVSTMTIDRATELSALIMRVIQSAAATEAAKEHPPGSTRV